MSYSSRFWLFAPLCMLLGLAAWAGVHWWNAASALDRKLDSMKGREAIPGMAIDWHSKTLSGFPFRLDTVFTGFSIKGTGAHGSFAWRSERFAFHALTYGAAKTVYEAAGPQQLAWTGGDGKAHKFTFLPAALHASSVLSGGGLSRFDLDIAAAGSRNFIAGRFQFHMRRDPDGRNLDLMLRADSVRPAGTHGAPAKNMQAYVSLTNASVFAPLLRGEVSWPDAARAWRSGGGVAKLSQVTAPEWSPDRLLSSLY
jgi:hypothetical protein